MNKVRCAIYTRKSSDEGLDQAFNSLDAQREACEAYILSQKHEGWKALPAHYDDGGASGGNLEREGLRRLMKDVDAGRVDMIVVYKIDRLTRSLADFAKLVDRLDAAGASFVSVTQQFNTSTSMGRLTLNVLLSFAQFEREVTAERIRDKIAASKKKGMWMGGLVPLGYDKVDTGLVINPSEAEIVRTLFKAYRDVGCVRRLKDFADGTQLQTKARTTKDGRCIAAKSFSRGRLYHLLSNPIYLGKIKHKEAVYEGLHDAIIDVDLWDKVHTQLTGNAVSRKTRQNAKNPSPLAGKVFDERGRKLTPTHASKAGKRYRYYISKDTSESEATSWRLSAAELEDAVRTALASHVDLQHTLERTSNDQDLISCVTRVQIHEEHLVVTAKVDGVNEPYLISAPFTIRRRGIETRLVLGHTTSRAVDIALIKRLLRASDWVDKIKSGASISSIAADENITPEYITHNIDLAYLSPKFLTAILEGTQRPDISAYQLSKMKIPAEWQAQESLFLL